MHIRYTKLKAVNNSIFVVKSKLPVTTIHGCTLNLVSYSSVSVVAPDGDSDSRFNTMSSFRYDFQVEKKPSEVKYSVCIHRILSTSGKICDFRKQLSELNSQVHGIHSMI